MTEHAQTVAHGHFQILFRTGAGSNYPVFQRQNIRGVFVFSLSNYGKSFRRRGRRCSAEKKIYYILIECLQNVFHHTGNLNDENGKSDFEGNDNAIFMISKSLADNYVITTGNFIPEKKISALKDRIDSINKMSKEELKALYLDQLNSTELSEKGGAGLGIIDIARKSGSKLNYSFHSVNPETSFFTLSIEIK